ncbi:polyketide synthase dehydratase domain-containing protein, partial [Actinomadura macra]|uniref:polyketide synthase dehydratase domain-containing protein n=1 Tax=Actinomadura macra TaxID=46164 RepID=UPI000ACE1E31
TGSGGAGDMGAAGLRPTDHPLLPAAIELADGEVALTGRISASSGRWLTHSVAGTELVPGSVLVEWALRAADEAGSDAVRELTLQEPLLLPASGAVLVRVAVDAPEPGGEREMRIHCRPEDEDTAWTCHAVGVLGPHAETGTLDGAWPPPGAKPVDVEGFYERAEAAGYTYGPASRGLRALWQDGPDLLAEVALPEGAEDRAGFGIHPVLLDAALHPVLLDDRFAPPDGHVRVPFTWAGVSLWAGEATTARVRLSPRGEAELSVLLADALGAPILTAESVVMRPAAVERLCEAGARAAAERPRRAQDEIVRSNGPVRRRRAGAGTGGAPGDWAARLAGLDGDERRRLVLDLVRGHSAAVLGHADAATVGLDATFKDLGLGSATAVELRGRLASATGLRLPTALVFRHPTPQDVAAELLRRLVPGDEGTPAGRNAAGPLLSELARLEAALTGADVRDGERDAVTARLEGLLAKWKHTPGHEAGDGAVDRLREASAEQVLDFIDNELGVS